MVWKRLSSTGGAALACAAEGNQLFVFVQEMVAAARLSPQGVAVRHTDVIAIWPAADIRHCIAWQARPDGTTLVIVA